MNVTQMPLTSLRTQEGVILLRERDLTTAEIKKLLSSVVVKFVIADVGKPLRWISENERFNFWKSDVQAHIVEAERKSLNDCPDDYFYCPSAWRSEEIIQVVVVLEKHH